MRHGRHITATRRGLILALLPTFLVGALAAPPVMLGVLEGVADAVSAVLKRVAGGLSDRAPRRKPFIVAGILINFFPCGAVYLHLKGSLSLLWCVVVVVGVLCGVLAFVF